MANHLISFCFLAKSVYFLCDVIIENNEYGFNHFIHCCGELPGHSNWRLQQLLIHQDVIYYFNSLLSYTFPMDLMYAVCNSLVQCPNMFHFLDTAHMFLLNLPFRSIAPCGFPWLNILEYPLGFTFGLLDRLSSLCSSKWFLPLLSPKLFSLYSLPIGWSTMIPNTMMAFSWLNHNGWWHFKASLLRWRYSSSFLTKLRRFMFYKYIFLLKWY